MTKIFKAQGKKWRETIFMRSMNLYLEDTWTHLVAWQKFRRAFSDFTSSVLTKYKIVFISVNIRNLDMLPW